MPAPFEAVVVGIKLYQPGISQWYNKVCRGDQPRQDLRRAHVANQAIELHVKGALKQQGRQKNKKYQFMAKTGFANIGKIWQKSP